MASGHQRSVSSCARANSLMRARAAVREAGLESFEISESGTDSGGRVSIGTMHLAKGLEFRAVAVMACDDELLPLAARIETAADEVELDEVYETNGNCSMSPDPRA